MPLFLGIFIEEVLNLQDMEEEAEVEPSQQGLPMEEQLLLLVEQSISSSVILFRSRNVPQCKSSSVAQCRSRNVILLMSSSARLSRSNSVKQLMKSNAAL